MVASEMAGRRTRPDALGTGDLESLAVLFDHLPVAAAYVAGDDLVFRYANAAYRRVAGREDLIGRPYREVLPGDRYAERLATLGHVLASGEAIRTREHEARATRPDGAPVATHFDWLHEPVRTPGGQILGVLFVGNDVSEHVADRRRLEDLAGSLAESEQRYRDAERVLLERNRLLERLWQANVIGVVVAGETGIEQANDAFLEIVGHRRDDLDAGRITWEAITPPDLAPLDADVVDELRRHGTCAPFEKDHLHRDGHRVPTLVGAVLLGRSPLRWAKFVVDLTARQRREQERTDLATRASAAAAAAAAAAERLDLLLAAGDLAAAAGSRRGLVDKVARLVVPSLASHGAVLLAGPRGSLRAAAVVHADPATQALLEDLLSADLPADGPTLPERVLGAQATALWNDDRDPPAWPGPVREMLEATRTRSVVAAPLLAGRRALGVLVLGRDHTRPRFGDDDVPVATELARRIATGLASLDAVAREHGIAETLQHALLPDALPVVRDVDLAVRYLPATGGLQVGGDWYDAFPLEGDRIALTLGDVVGHSIESASLMGQIRSMLRTCAIEDPAPDEVLRRTNAAVCRLLPDALATAVYAVLDVATGELTYGSAGHPPPLAVDEIGRAEVLCAAGGVMLGVGPGATYRSARHHVAPGGRLLLYSDGLVESRGRTLAEGLEHLVETLQSAPTASAEETCERVLAHVPARDDHGDDICLLALHRRSGPPR